MFPKAQGCRIKIAGYFLPLSNRENMYVGIFIILLELFLCCGVLEKVVVGRIGDYLNIIVALIY
jgi:hypothetical protein